MKARIEKYQKALDAFLEKDYWRTLYEEAPDGAKGWLEAEFDASLSDDEPPEGEDPDEHLYKDAMKREDWEWLAEYDCHHPEQKKYFLRMAKESKE